MKELNELAYWRNIKKLEGEFSNLHYEYFYTTHFEIPKTFYDGKVLLDLGCGPRGSLEWADNAKRRIGLDPLATEYLKLGADKHKMEYINSDSENMPFKDGECDFIFSFNSFDHVNNVFDTSKEIKRCLPSKGIFLLLVEVNHPSTACEPHTLSPKDIVNMLSPELRAEKLQVFRRGANGIYQSIKLGEKYNDPLNCRNIGYLSAKFIKI
jgi:ubiquinone/menaquinone biosynthesis C-methylase UbiE